MHVFSTYEIGIMTTSKDFTTCLTGTGVVSSRLSQVTPFVAIAQLNFSKESTSYIHNTKLGISNITFT